MNAKILSDIAYLTSAILFIVGLKFLSHPKRARRGNLLAALGMAFAIIASFIFIYGGGAPATGLLIILGIVIGGVVGAVAARRVAMTDMPQMVALLNGCGGGAAALISTVEFAGGETADPLAFGATIFGCIIGSISFAGSLVAFGKLQGIISERAITSTAQKIFNGLLFLWLIANIAWIGLGGGPTAYYVFLAGSLVFGVLMVIPIGGADMPVVISLLNSFTGLAVASTGFALKEPALVISGTLVGASGTLLTMLMCKAMNRSLANVLFAGVGAGPVAKAGAKAGGPAKSAREISFEDAAVLMANVSSVIMVPGYGMAVAQAQHVMRDLADLLAKKGVDGKYAVHPVAGRRPGHMNVRLAEANVPYTQLFDLEQINPDFEHCGVALVVGANDVVNPAARYDKASPIYGMPILDVDKAEHCIIIKRSLNPGFAGIDNELYYAPKTFMLFGDARDAIRKLAEAARET